MSNLLHADADVGATEVLANSALACNDRGGREAGF